MSKPKKIAVITGASSGMGREFARRIEEKYRGELDEIWLIARRRERLEELAGLHRLCRSPDAAGRACGI